MPATIRAFIAIPVPVMVRTFIGDIQQRLRGPGMDVRWVRPENVHLTLAFLGDIDAARVAAIGQQIDTAVMKIPSFSLSAGGTGVFPDLRRARVVWIGLKGDIDRLIALKTRLDALLATVGFSPERRTFRPHLTIGRPKRRLPAAVVGVFDQMQDAASETFRVEQVNLYQSTLKPTGAVYTPLYTAPLANING